MASDGSVKILIQADGADAIAATDRVEKAFNGLGSAGQKTGSMLKSFLGANLISSAVTSGLGLLKDSFGDLLGDLNDASKAWQTFDANMKNLNMPDAKIKATKKELQQYAQETIYSASDMASTYAQLAAVGTKNTDQLVKGFGGLAAASEDPAQAMKTLSQQATQMAAKPKVAWEDFKLMLEQSPAGMAAVAKTMHKSTSQLISDIQAGKVSTKDFFAAVATTGTNANFTKMATQYKTVDQAMDGLKETLTNGLQPAFDQMSQVAIGAISKVTDAIGKIDFSKVINSIGKSDIVTSIAGQFQSTNWDALLEPLQSSWQHVQSTLGHLDTSGINSALDSLVSQSASAAAGIIGAFAPVGNGIVTALGNLSNAFQPLFQSFAGLDFGTLLAPLQTIGTTIGATIAQLDFSGIKALAGQILPALSAGFTSFMGVAGPAITGVVTAFKNLWNAAQPIVSTIASVLVPAFQVLGSYLGGVFSAVLSGISTAFNLVAGALRLVQPLVSLLATGFQAIAPALAVVASWVGKLVGLFGGLGGAATALKSVAGAAFNGIRSAVAVAGDGISATGGIIKVIWSGLRTAASGLKAIVVAAWGMIRSGVSSAGSGVNAVGNAIKSGWSALKAAASTLKAGVSAAWSGITGAVRVAKTTIAGIVNSIKSIFAGLGHINLASAGKAIMSGFLGGLTSAYEKVKDFVSGIASWIKKHKGPIRYDARLLVPAGDAIMTGLNLGLTKQFESVKANVSGMASQIASLANSGFSGIAVQGGAEHFARLSSASVPNAQTINNYTNTTNNTGASNKVLDLLQQIADKSPIIDANSLAGGMAPFNSAQTAQRNKIAMRGGATFARIQ